MLLLVLLTCICCVLSTDETFFSAARLGNTAEVTNYLNNGTSVHSRDGKGNTAIIISAGRGMVEVMQVLLKYGANPEDMSNGGLFDGKTALCWAASQGREKAVALLLQAGANPHKAMDRGVFQGKTALQWAASQGKTDVVRVLLASNVDVDYASEIGNFKGKNALMWACSQGRVDTVAVLLEAGASVDAVDNDGISALMWATGSETSGDNIHKKGLMEKAQQGHIDVVKQLLQYGAQPDLRDKDGITAVMYASFHGHAGALEILLNAGSDASYRNKDGKTALQLAVNAGFIDAANAIKRGPTIMSLDIPELAYVPTCGWLLSVLRAPKGTGIFYHTRKQYRHDSDEIVGIYNIAHSCRILTKHGLDDSLHDLIALLKYTAIDDVVDHLGITIYAAKVRAKGQLQQLLDRFNAYYNASSATIEVTVDV